MGQGEGGRKRGTGAVSSMYVWRWTFTLCVCMYEVQGTRVPATSDDARVASVKRIDWWRCMIEMVAEM